jgi:hypothetical protein
LCYKTSALLLVCLELPEAVRLQLDVKQSLLLRFARMRLDLFFLLPVEVLYQVRRSQLLLKVAQLRGLLPNPSNLQLLALSLQVLALKGNSDHLVFFLRLPLLSKLLLVADALFDLNLHLAIALLSLAAHGAHALVAVH